MITYKDQSKTVTHKVIDQITCDLCGGDIKPDPIGEHSAQIYTYFEPGDHLNPMLPEPEQYPGRISCEMCTSCFHWKLVPWLESQGVQMRKEYFRAKEDE